MIDAIPIDDPAVHVQLWAAIAEVDTRLRDAYGTRGKVRWSDLGAMLDSHARLMDLVEVLAERCHKQSELLSNRAEKTS